MFVNKEQRINQMNASKYCILRSAHLELNFADFSV